MICRKTMEPPWSEGHRESLEIDQQVEVFQGEALVLRHVGDTRKAPVPKAPEPLHGL